MKNELDDKNKNETPSGNSKGSAFADGRSNSAGDPDEGNASVDGGPSISDSGLGSVAASGSTDSLEELKHGHSTADAGDGSDSAKK